MTAKEETPKINMILHPKEAELIMLTRKMGYGVITSLKIQHSLPESADVPMKKIRFGEKG